VRSNKDKKRQDQERRVFHSFAKVCPLPILDSSIASRCPPEPDILCEIIGEGTVAFEMTCVEAEQYHSERAEQDRTLDKAKDFQVAVAKYLVLEKRYWGALFFLDDGKLSIEQICQLLDQAPHDREQLFLLEHGIDLEYGGGNHPPVLVVDAIEIRYAIREHIAKKLRKVAKGILKSSYPIEILLHFKGLGAARLDWEQRSEQLRSSLIPCLPKSQVRRVWIFDPQAEVVRFVHPPTERIG